MMEKAYDEFNVFDTFIKLADLNSYKLHSNFQTQWSVSVYIPDRYNKLRYDFLTDSYYASPNFIFPKF